MVGSAFLFSDSILTSAHAHWQNGLRSQLVSAARRDSTLWCISVPQQTEHHCEYVADRDCFKLVSSPVSCIRFSVAGLCWLRLFGCGRAVPHQLLPAGLRLPLRTAVPALRFRLSVCRQELLAAQSCRRGGFFQFGGMFCCQILKPHLSPPDIFFFGVFSRVCVYVFSRPRQTPICFLP